LKPKTRLKENKENVRKSDDRKKKNIKEKESIPLM
jgi:hypothetical protein